MAAPADKAIRRLVLLVASLASLLAPFSGSATNIALPTIGKEFSADAITLNWVASSYLLAAAMCLVPFGKVADTHGRKKVFVTGLFIYSVTSLLSALAPSIRLLITMRVLQGVGSSMVFGTGIAIITSVFPAPDRGRALGITAAAVYAGLSIGPFAGGLLTAYFGWRSIFVATAALGLLAAILAAWKLNGEWAEARGERFDVPGCLLYSAALTAIMYGFSRLPSARGAELLLCGVLILALFTWWEMRCPAPLLHLNLFLNQAFAFSNLSALINYSATFAVGFLMSLYLQYVKGLTPEHAGVTLVAQPLLMAIVSPFAGRLSDRVESRIVSSAGMAVTVVGLVLLAALRASTSLPYIIASQVILGIGFALFSSPNTNAVMGSIAPRFYGVASATLGTMRLVGQMLSMGVAMLVFALHLGREPITAAHAGAFLLAVRTAFLVFAVLCFGGVFASMARGRTRIKPQFSSDWPSPAGMRRPHGP